MKTTEYKIDNYEITEETNDYRIIEGLTYWEDASHFGSVWLTQEMYDKYDLDRCGHCESIEEAYGEYDPEWMPERKFCYVIYIDHCSGVTPIGVEFSEADRKDGKWINFKLNATQETPHGECYEEDFVAWWCQFPAELLDEPDENVLITGWCDG